jgi:branched-chain amino acid transport system substrate-binding protein
MRRILGGFFVAAAAAAFATSAVAQDTIKIGMVCGFTGQFADASARMDEGVRLYLKDHGDTVAGKKIEIIRKDTGGVAPDLAKRLAQELVVRDKVDVLACLESTPNALAVADVSAQAKKLVVDMSASTSAIVGRSPYMVRTSFTNYQLNESLGTWAFKNGIRTAYTLVGDYSPGWEGETVFQAAFKAAGGQIIGSARYPAANLDFSVFLRRAKDSHADAVYIWVPNGPQAVAVGKTIVEIRINNGKTKVLGQFTLTEDDALASLGESALGLITTATYDYSHHSSVNDAFVKEYNATFGHNPDVFGVGGYDGMRVIYEALNKTKGNSDADQLIAAIKGMQWESPRGPVMIDPQTRDIVQNVYIRRVEKVDGKIGNVEFDKMAMVKDPWKPAAAK